MDRSEAEELASSDIILRYGLAELIASGYQEGPAEEAASSRLASLKNRVLAYVEPKDYDEDATGTASAATDLTPGSASWEKSDGYISRVHVFVQKTGFDKKLGKTRTGLIPALDKGKPQGGGKMLQRYYPHVSKLSTGNKHAGYARASQLARQLAFITTLTPHKPSRIVDQENNLSAALLPDLSLEDLVTFVETFKEAPGPGLRWRSNGEKVYLEERNGNFRGAPPAWAFSTAGLIAAIGRWQEDAEYDLEARELAKRIAGAPLVVVGQKGFSPASFNRANHLPDLIEETRLVVENAWKPPSEGVEDRYYAKLRRFLQRYSWHALRRLLSIRLEYPREFEPFFTSFFTEHMNGQIVEAAKAAGKHANTCCYRAAQDNDSYKDKETYLTEIENTITGADTCSELLARFSTRVGRLPGGDLPESAEPFFDYLHAEGDPSSEEETPDLEKAKNVLQSYLRIGADHKSSAGGDAGEDGNSSASDTGASDTSTDLDYQN